MKRFKKALFITMQIAFWAIPLFIFEMVDEKKQLGIFSTTQFTFFYPVYYGVALSMIYFYTCIYWIMPTLLKKNNVIIAFLGAFATYIIHTCIETIIDCWVAKSNTTITDAVSFLEALVINLIINIFIFLLAVGYFFLKNMIISERNKLKLREEKLKMELDFLKSQINPHFMFNVLNNLYGTAKKNNDEETANGIAQLAGLMRYILKGTNENKVLLKNEIEYIKNYIKLQESRFSAKDDIVIYFDEKEADGSHWIVPMVLITFVENAFMHGISLVNPSFIFIKLKTNNNKIFFEVNNSIKPLSQAKYGSGLGLKNTKKRLDLIYGNNYNLTIIENPNKFTIQLEIKNSI